MLKQETQSLHLHLVLCLYYLPILLTAALHLWFALAFKVVGVVAQALFCPPSTPYDEVCETFTQQGYERLQEAALGTNHAENPLISEVTITCGMLTWYRTRWCFRWGAPHMGKHRISALNSHDKGTKPVLWSLSSIMTGCMSSIGTDLCLQCWGLWSSEALYSTVEYNVKYCCSAWNLSSFINANIQIWEVHVHIS